MSAGNFHRQHHHLIRKESEPSYEKKKEALETFAEMYNPMERISNTDRVRSVSLFFDELDITLEDLGSVSDPLKFWKNLLVLTAEYRDEQTTRKDSPIAVLGANTAGSYSGYDSDTASIDSDAAEHIEDIREGVYNQLKEIKLCDAECLRRFKELHQYVHSMNKYYNR
jgi:hypothetical protein